MKWISLLSVILPAFLLAPAHASDSPPSVKIIIQRSDAANLRDWKAAPDYDYYERDRQKDGGTKTYEIRMIQGSPYQQLVSVNGKPLSGEKQADEQRKLQSTIATRKKESPKDRERRIAKYEEGRRRNHLLMDQMSKALQFAFVEQQKLGSHEVYLLSAKPRPGYHPPNNHAKVLTGMEGKLWIDTKTFEWVKVVAKVVHPVSIEGFLARVEPGTQFELEKMPVGDGIWLSEHFSMKSKARVFFFFTRHSQEDETYFNYRRRAK